MNATSLPPPHHPPAEDADGLAARLRGFDWAGTPLGDVSTWPAPLAEMIGKLLAAQHDALPHVDRRHAAEDALRDSEERFRLAVQSSSLGTWDTDLDEDRILLSPRAMALFDVDVEGLAVVDLLERVHPDDRERLLAAVDRSRDPRGDGAYRIRHRVVHRDGGVRWLDATGRVTRLARAGGGEQQRFVGVLADITEQQQLMDLLREADRRKDEFLATLAHELRNPLAPIRTAAHMLTLPDIGAERVAWCADLIRRQSATMARLLDELLEISRMSSGRLDLRWVETDARAIVDAALETAGPEIEARRHTLQVDVPDGLPPLHADPLRVSQILINLLGNAAKYTEPGGHVALSVRRTADRLVFEVADDGVGIAADMLHAVFEMFHQVPGSRNRAQGGLGIGLALSQGLAALHGGRVDAFSDGLGRGATFRLTLPFNDDATPSSDLD